MVVNGIDNYLIINDTELGIKGRIHKTRESFEKACAELPLVTPDNLFLTLIDKDGIKSAIRNPAFKIDWV